MKLFLGIGTALAALCLPACTDVSVGAARARLRAENPERVVEARNHRIELRYLPRALRLLEAAQFPDSTRLTSGMLDSLSRARPDVGRFTFLMRLGPREDSSHRDLSNDAVYGNISGYDDYQQTSKHYAFGLRDRIWLEVEGEKVPLAGYQMENTYGLAPERYFVLSFRDIGALKNKKASVRLVLDDIVPGLTRKKITWTLPVGKYDNAI